MVPNFRIPDLEMFPIVPKPRVVPMFPTRKNCSHVPKVFPSSAMFPCSLFPIGTQSMLVPIGKRHVPIGKQNHCCVRLRGTWVWQLGVCSGDQNTDTRRKTIAVHFQSTKDNRARQTVNARRICNLRRDRHFTFAVTTPLISVNPLLL